MQILNLKGQWQRILGFRFFSWITFPQAPENNIRVISNTSQGAPQVSTTPAANFATSSACVVDTGGKFVTGVMGPISGCRHLKVNLKEIIKIYVNFTAQRCPNKISKIFLIEDFFSFATSVNDTGGAPWAANISANFRKNSKWL